MKKRNLQNPGNGVDKEQTCGLDKGTQERGICRRSGRVLVRVDPRYFRPTEVDHLLGDPSKARAKLGWTHRVAFRELVKEMMTADLADALRRVEAAQRSGSPRP